jgi:hypothetical protein
VATVSPGQAAFLVDAFAAAAGVAAVGDGLQSAYELRAVDYIGWPATRLAERLPGRDPVRKMRLGDLRDELRGMVGGPVGAQQAEIDNTLNELAGDICAPLPLPWSRTVRAATKSQADRIPAELGGALKESIPEVNRLPSWWRLVRVWQWALIAVAAAGLAWLGALIAFGVLDISRQSTPLLDDPTLIPWVCVMIAAILLLGWLTSAGCQNVVSLAAERQRDRIAGLIRGRIAGVAQDKVLMPIQQELSEYARYCDELRSAGLV